MIAQLVERETVVLRFEAISRSLVQIRFAGLFFTLLLNLSLNVNIIFDGFFEGALTGRVFDDFDFGNLDVEIVILFMGSMECDKKSQF